MSQEFGEWLSGWGREALLFFSQISASQTKTTNLHSAIFLKLFMNFLKTFHIHIYVLYIGVLIFKNISSAEVLTNVQRATTFLTYILQYCQSGREVTCHCYSHLTDGQTEAWQAVCKLDSWEMAGWVLKLIDSVSIFRSVLILRNTFGLFCLSCMRRTQWSVQMGRACAIWEVRLLLLWDCLCEWGLKTDNSRFRQTR